MDDLIAFLNARLDEDEAAAKAAICAGDGTWTQGVSMFDPEVMRAADASVAGEDLFIAKDGDNDIRLPHAVYIARHDPARALREVEAKRAIVAACVTAQADVPPVDDWYEVADGVKVGCADGLEAAVRHLAAVHSDHPDYRQEWAPVTAGR